MLCRFIALLRRHHRPPSPSQGVPGKVRQHDAGTEARVQQEGTLEALVDIVKKKKGREPEEEGDQKEAAESLSGEDQVGEGSF